MHRRSTRDYRNAHQGFYALLHHVSAELDQLSDQVLQERLGIGLSQYRVLLALVEKDGITQKEIAEKLAQTEPSISRQIKLIKIKKMISVERSISNRRERKVFLTDKGSGVVESATDILNEYHQPVFNSLPDQEQWNLVQTLQKLEVSLR